MQPDQQPAEVGEKYSSQVLRRMHQDAAILLSEYDRIGQHLEHPEIDGHLKKKLQMLVAELGKIEGLHREHHGADEAPLEGSFAGHRARGVAGRLGQDTGTGDETSETTGDWELRMGGKSLGIRPRHKGRLREAHEHLRRLAADLTLRPGCVTRAMPPVRV
jgi:hypothetical protein